MPRNGSGIYSQPFPDVVEGTTIESTVYNGYTNDVTIDLNTPRPIVAGGTGANNAHDAMIALSGEISKQVITNYSSFPFVNGSFYSVAGATDAPNPTNRFAGIYYGNADDSYATAEARDQTTGILYVKKKVAGVWDATWTQQVGGLTDLDAAHDARYVNVTGDTMTGALNVTAPSGTALTVNGTTSVPALFLSSLGGTAGSLVFQGATPVPASGDRIAGSLYGQTSDNGATLRTGASVEAITSQAWTPGTAHGTYLELRTTPNGTASRVGALRVQPSGGVSIGTPAFMATDPGAGNLAIGATTTSTTPTTGALTVAGGVGVAGAIVVGGNGAVNGTLGVGSALNVVGAITAAAKGHKFGQAGGATYNAAHSSSDANVLLYNNGTDNWCGMGVDVNGNFWLRTGTSGATTANNAMTVVADTRAVAFNGAATLNSTLTCMGTVNVLQAFTATAGGSCSVAGGAGISYSAANVALRVGYLGGGTQYGMSYHPTTDNTTCQFFENASFAPVGTIGVTTVATSYNTSSDGRLKDDLKSFDAGNVVDNTDVYDFAWKTTGERSYGVIAQQAAEVYPAAVTYLKEQDWYGIDYSKYVPVLLQELKALRARVAALEGGATIGAQPAKKK